MGGPRGHAGARDGEGGEAPHAKGAGARAHQIEALSLMSTLPMTAAFGAMNTAAPSFGRWSKRFITARCLLIRSLKSQLSWARQPMRSIA